MNYQPVKFLEFCSVGHNSGAIYDDQTSSRPYQINNNAYIGLHCDCNFSNKPKNDDCAHAIMHNDSNVIKLIFEVAVANQRADDATLAYIDSLDPIDLENSVQNCDHIKPSIFD